MAAIAMALALMMAACGPARAAGQAEARDYESVVKDMEIMEWGRAEEAAAKFIAKYPAAENFSKVVLFEAQAQYKQGKCGELVELLTTNQSRAGAQGDQFNYWLGQGYFCGSDYHLAAETFARLVRNYPASSLRPEAMFSEADARSKLNDWAGVTESLGKAEGPFQQFARTSPTNSWVMKGQLLLGEAQAHQGDYAGAAATFQGMKADSKTEWLRLDLLCEAQLLAGHKQQAQETIALLLAAAQGHPDWMAQSINLQGRIFEEMDQLPEAIKSYDALNQNADLPAAQRRLAFLKAVDLIMRQNKFDEAEQRLNDYSNTHPELDANGLQALTQGELLLRKYYLAKSGRALLPTDTNNLTLAKAKFDGIIAATNKEYLGKAELNLGWCLWEERKYPESAVAFSNAVQQIPFSTEQAVARFKMGDALYELKDFAGAAACYKAVVDQYGAFIAVKNELFERALYQLVRTGLEQTNLDLATDAVHRILEWFPDGLMGQPSVLLVGQGLSAQGDTAAARTLFEGFVSRWPQSALLPEVKLAIARTYEAERDWNRAMKEYDDWVAVYTNSPSYPRAAFARAQVNYEAGHETNAFMLFTNFVARFPSNELTLKAQFWLGDHYWRQPDYISAEAQYQEVYKSPNAVDSGLQYEALMMAGRAAMQRENYVEAIGYFTNLFRITNCPLGLRLEALFAAGDARKESAATASATNLAVYGEAIESYFKPITNYSSNRIAALAWGRIGDCYRLMAAGDPSKYLQSSNAYQQAILSPLADISTRSMAEFGLAMCLEAMARLKPVGTQLEGKTAALGHYLNVAEGRNRREGETADPFWVKEAGKAAGALDEDMGEWEKAAALYSYLMEDQPSWKSYWEKRIELANKKARDKPTSSKVAGGN